MATKTRKSVRVNGSVKPKPDALAPSDTGKKVAVQPKHTLTPVESVAPPLSSSVKPKGQLAEAAAELQTLQRQRAVILKSRNMQKNRLQAVVAGTLGYHSGMEEKDRSKKFSEAAELIEKVNKGEVENPNAGIIRTTMIGITAFEDMKSELEKAMVKLVKSLPIAKWVQEPEQRGFGPLFLAIIIGETGDLSSYTNPGKVWKRLGCAPWTFEGKTLMGATWRGGKEGKLPAAEWEKFGYNPRRRSIAFLVGEGIVKQNTLKSGTGGEGSVETETTNTPGPYRVRYDEAKEKAKTTHPDWTDLRRHRHAMLLATKLLLKQLWIRWNKEAGTYLPETEKTWA